jgi:hypothetical protein
MKKEMKATYSNEYDDQHHHFIGYLNIDYSVSDDSITVRGETKIPIRSCEKEPTPAEIVAKLIKLTDAVEIEYTRLLGILELLIEYAERKEIDFKADIKLE